MKNNNDVIVRPLHVKEIHHAVAIHESSFPNYFLTSLGPFFLKLLYLFYIKGKTEIALAALYNNKLIGTIIGTTKPQGFYKRLATRYFPFFAFATLGPLIKNPEILPRLFRAFFYRGDMPSISEGGTLLASICINPSFQRIGIGRILLSEFVAQAFAHGAHYIYLITDRENNEKTISFYEKLGWTLYSEFITAEGRKMNVFCKFNSD